MPASLYHRESRIESPKVYSVNGVPESSVPRDEEEEVCCALVALGVATGCGATSGARNHSSAWRAISGGTVCGPSNSWYSTSYPAPSSWGTMLRLVRLIART